MEVQRLQVEGYRSLTDVSVDFAQITVLVGANGTGKTNLYRALRLAHTCGTGQVARAIATEGGMKSSTYAGWHRGEDKVCLTVDLDGLSYDVTLATVARGALDSPTAFPLDPVITHEHILLAGDGLTGTGGRRVELMERVGSTAFVRDDDGNRVTFPATFHPSESVLTQLLDDLRFPELQYVRNTLRRMRFHHQLRTDDDAPARLPAVGTRTLAVADDGADLASALATIDREGDRRVLHEVVEAALDGQLVLEADEVGRIEVALQRPEILRPFTARELSDGQLRFLFLAAALLSPRPPAMVVLNEPESSLHDQLVPALAELIVATSESTQVVVTTHSATLADALLARNDSIGHRLTHHQGRTSVDRL